MTPHGPDTATYEAAISEAAERPAHLGRDTLAFMFETHLTPRVTPAALGSPCIDTEYYRCWVGLKSHFNRDWAAQQQQQQQQQQRQQQRQPMASAAAAAAAGGTAKQAALPAHTAAVATSVQ
jgi:homogentisate 1,2-dioxygenase